MRLRDRPYKESTVVYIARGLADGVSLGLVDALNAYLTHPASFELREPLGRTPSAVAIRRAAEEAVVRIDGAPSSKDMVVQARFAGFGRVPCRVLVSDDAVAVAVNHGAMDGSPILELVTWLLTVASGAPGVRDERDPVRFPMIRGLRKAGRPAIDRFLSDRRLPQLAPVLTAPPTDMDLALETAQFTTLRITPEQIDRIVRLPAGGPTTLMSRVTSVSVTALRRLYTGTGDVPVIIPVDVRRFVKNGRVLGNFMGVASTASLLGSDWTPSAVAARSLAGIKGGTAMVGSAYAFARWLAHSPRRLLRRAGRPGAGRISVFVPLLSLPKGMPGVRWRDDESASIGAVTIATWPSGTSIGTLAFRDSVFLTVWDETGAFDLGEGRFVDALADEISSLEAAAETAAGAA